jgi:N-acetylmuramoyl-L-alanine amidase
LTFAFGSFVSGQGRVSSAALISTRADSSFSTTSSAWYTTRAAWRLDRSLEFASLLGAQLKARALKYTHHYTERFMGDRQRELVDAMNGVYRYDQLIVLRTTQMPAVLLEAGSIINRREEIELAKPERVALVADAATHAVETYCDAHGHHIAEAPSLPAQTVRPPAVVMRPILLPLASVTTAHRPAPL